jgi:hypothetical protein
VAPGVLRAELRRRGSASWAAETSFADPDELAAAIGALPSEAPAIRRACRLEVDIEPPLLQVRTLRGLPPVRGRALAALVAHQAGRFFRKNGKPLVTDAAWIGSRRRTAPVARGVAVELPWVDAILAGARGGRLPVPTIGPAGSGPVRLDLVPPAERARRRRTALGRVGGLAALAALLWAGVGAAYVVRLERARRQLTAEAARLRKASDAVVTARRALHETTAMVDAVDQASAARGARLIRLGTLLTLMPDSASLSSLELDAVGAGSLTGTGPRAADIVAALERSGVVAGPQMVGTPVPEEAAGHRGERFTVRFGKEAKR